MCNDEIHHALSSQVSQYLLTSKKWWKIDEQCNEDGRIVYLKGKPNKDEEECIVVPMLPHEKTDCQKLQSYFQILKSTCLTIAIVAQDSTVVFYNVRKGLNPPPTPLDNNSDYSDM